MIPVTETVIFHVQEGVSLQGAKEGATSNGNPAVRTFLQAVSAVKGQPGVVRQYWGHQVEDPSLFLWYIDWQSTEHHDAFHTSKSYAALKAELATVFDYESAEPLTTFTQWPQDPTAALRSPVTEIAFCTLPHDFRESSKKDMEKAWDHILVNVQKIGKAHGAAIGWVYKTTPADHKAAKEGHAIWIHGVFGYDSIEDHMKWREAPEHAKALETMEALAAEYHLGGADIQGTDMFHVVLTESI